MSVWKQRASGDAIHRSEEESPVSCEICFAFILACIALFTIPGTVTMLVLGDFAGVF